MDSDIWVCLGFCLFWNGLFIDRVIIWMHCTGNSSRVLGFTCLDLLNEDFVYVGFFWLDSVSVMLVWGCFAFRVHPSWSGIWMMVLGYCITEKKSWVLINLICWFYFVKILFLSTYNFIGLLLFDSWYICYGIWFNLFTLFIRIHGFSSVWFIS